MHDYKEIVMNCARSKYATFFCGVSVSTLFYILFLQNTFYKTMWNMLQKRIFKRAVTSTVDLIQNTNKKVIVLGIHATGKTLLLKQIGKAHKIYPNLSCHGTNIFTIKSDKYDFDLWDTFPIKKKEELDQMSIFIQDCDVLLFLIDSSKKVKLFYNVLLLKDILQHENFVNTSVLIVATKQDSPKAIKLHQLEHYLKCFISSHKFEVLGSKLKTISETKTDEDRASAVEVMEKLITMTL